MLTRSRREALAWLAALPIALGCRARTEPAEAPAPQPPAPPPPPPPAPPAPQPPSPVAWEPARTWVLVVGVLHWLRSDLYPSFDDDDDGRRDAALGEAFQARGVPASQVTVLLDREATLAAVRAALGSLVQRAATGDTVWFFFGGHGCIDDGVAYFVPYDAGDTLSDSGLAMASVIATLGRGLRGGRIFLTADCCHAGSLAALARSLDGVAQWAAFGSSLASEESADSWTFTDCVIDAISGAPAADLDRDGRVGVIDLGRYADTRMAFVDRQLACSARSRDLPPGLALSVARGPHDPRSDVRFEARWQGDWYPVEVLDTSAEGVHVRYLTRGDPSEEVLAPSQVRPWVPVNLPVGTRVDARVEDRWHPAVVLDARLGIHQVRFDADADLDDAWVAPASLRRPRR